MGIAKIGALFLRLFIVRPRARNDTWAGLLQEALQAKSRFDAELSGITEEEAKNRLRPRAELACINDIVAHLSTAHAGVTQVFQWILSKETSPLNLDISLLFLGAQGRTIYQIREEYEQNWKALMLICQNVLLPGSKRTVSHFLFGNLTSREWLVVVAIHYQYHLRQVKRLRHKMDYKEVTW